MTQYDKFEQLKELTKLTKTEKGFSKFIQTGNLSLYDYGRGFIELEIYAYLDYNGKQWVRIWFGTVDDGDFGGWISCASLEEAQLLARRVATEVFENMISFPFDEDLNELLQPYGVHVGYE